MWFGVAEDGLRIDSEYLVISSTTGAG